MVELFDPVYKIVLLDMENIEDGQPVLAIKETLLEYQKEAIVIEKQLQSCLKDHEILRKYAKDVVDENRRLMKLLKDKSENESGSQSLVKLEESLLIRNLQHQLAITANQRDTIKEMWVLSCKTVEDLQNEVCRCNEQMESKAMFKQIDNLKRDYSDAISLMEKKLNSVKEELNKECGQNMELVNKIKYLQQEMDITCEKNKTLELQLTASSKQNDELKNKLFALETKCIHLEALTACRNVDNHKELTDNNEFQKIKTERNELQKALEKCHSTIDILSIQSSTSKDKVEEAVRLVEEAVKDRDSILVRAEQGEEECRRLQMEIKGLINEAGLQVAQELAACKEQHAQEIKRLQAELEIAKQDSANKGAEVTQLTKECKRLENMLCQTNTSASNPTKLEKKIDTLFSNLQVLENTNVQILTENEALKHSFESLYERHRRCRLEKALYCEQIFLMEKQIERLEKELVIATESASNISVEMQNINLQTSRNFREENDQLVLQIQQIQEKNVAASKELHRHVEAHNDIARKWKNEMEALTDAYETKLQKLTSDRKKRKKNSKELNNTKTHPDLSDQQKRCFVKSSENIDTFKDDCL